MAARVRAAALLGFGIAVAHGAGACGGQDGAATGALPPFAEPATLTDTNPDPNVVEVNLVAAPATAELRRGQASAVWAYRDGAVAGSTGTVPGPVLRAKKGDEIVVHFKNEIDALTTIHWHGLRLPAASDGTFATQRLVDPGNTYEYRFVAGDASTFWYHPHWEADEQIERGLYAPLVVAEGLGGAAPDVAADRIMVLDDVKLDAAGGFPTRLDHLDRMMGRMGNVILVNGREAPLELRVTAGSRERWRFVNAANGRFFKLRLPGLRFLVIGSDGGIIPEPFWTDTVLVTPGERYDVLVTFEGGAGTRRALETLHHDRGHDLPDPGPRRLLAVVYGPAGAAPGPLPATWRTLEHIPVSPSTPVRPMILEEEERPGGAVFFKINGEVHPNHTPFEVGRGEVEIWEVKNEAPMDHPFHLHGMFFEVLPEPGKPQRPDWWKDTVNVPQKASRRLAVRYDAPPGSWMFHCHILEHAELGMMGHLIIR